MAELDFNPGGLAPMLQKLGSPMKVSPKHFSDKLI